MKAILSLCITCVILAGIGAGAYTQHQNSSEKYKQAQIQQQINNANNNVSIKKLKYQECEDNNRRAMNDTSNKFSSLEVSNCNLIW